MKCLSLPQQSEEPIYRISTLEGQVRLCQDKLIQAHRHHEDMLANERARCEEKLSSLRQSHDSEMKQAQKRITELEAKVAEVEAALEKASKPQPEVKVDGGTPTSSPARRRKYKRREQEATREGEVAKDRNVFSPTRSVSPDTFQRSASTSDLREGERGRERKEDVNRSVDMVCLPRPLHERLTITELVTDSLNKPGSMLAIRRELKADALTPKILKKFPPKAKPTSLPAVQGSVVNETSPLARTAQKSTSRVSPRGSKTPPHGNGKI